MQIGFYHWSAKSFLCELLIITLQHARVIRIGAEELLGHTQVRAGHLLRHSRYRCLPVSPGSGEPLITRNLAVRCTLDFKRYRRKIFSLHKYLDLHAVRVKWIMNFLNRIVWCTSSVLIASLTSSSIMDLDNIGVASFATTRIVPSISYRFDINRLPYPKFCNISSYNVFIIWRSPSPLSRASWRKRRVASGRSSRSGRADTSLSPVPSSPTKKLWVVNWF